MQGGKIASQCSKHLGGGKAKALPLLVLALCSVVSQIEEDTTKHMVVERPGCNDTILPIGISGWYQVSK